MIVTDKQLREYHNRAQVVMEASELLSLTALFEQFHKDDKKIIRPVSLN